MNDEKPRDRTDETGATEPTGAAKESAREGSRTRKSFLLRLDPELHAELRRWADQEMRSLNAHVEYLLRRSVRERARGRAPHDEP